MDVTRWEKLVSRVRKHKEKCDYDEPEMESILEMDTEHRAISASLMDVQEMNAALRGEVELWKKQAAFESEQREKYRSALSRYREAVEWAIYNCQITDEEEEEIRRKTGRDDGCQV